MRIVHAVCSDAFAGVEQYIARLAAAQHDAGHQVAVIGGDPDAMSAAIGRKGVPNEPASTVLDAVRAINRWAQCDVLHVHMTAAELAATLAVQARRVPVVSTRHFGARRGASRTGKVLAPIVARRVQAQIAVSRHVAELIDGASTVVYSGVNNRPKARPARDRSSTVLMVQRLEPEKRTDLGVSIFAASGLATDGWRLQIVGRGSMGAALERHVKTLGLSPSVDLMGFRSDIDRLMGEAAILLASCPNEGLGVTVLEAMANGLPIVAASGGGHLETLAGMDGRTLYPALDVVQAGAQLADLALDVAGRDALSQAEQGRQQTQFTLEAQRLGTDAVYAGLW